MRMDIDILKREGVCGRKAIVLMSFNIVIL
jgi:hypothetical protein